MRRRVVLLALLSLASVAGADVEFGMRYGAAVCGVYPDPLHYRMLPVFEAGVVLVLPGRGPVALQLEAIAGTEGYRGGGYDVIRVPTVAIPVLLRYPFAVPGPGWLEATVVAGPRPTFRLGGAGERSDGSIVSLENEQVGGFDLGITAGLELAARVGPHAVTLDLRVNVGVLPVLREDDARVGTASASLGYRIAVPGRSE